MSQKTSTQLSGTIAYVWKPCQRPKAGTLALAYLLREADGPELIGYHRGLPNTYISKPQFYSPQSVSTMLGQEQVIHIKKSPQIQEGQLVIVDSEGAIHIAAHPDRNIVRTIGHMPLGAI